MKATIKWVEGVQFLAESGSGHAVLMEGPESEGGRNIGCRPMELMLMGLGGCTSYDVINILGKARQSVRDCVAEISAQRADDVPHVFTEIHVHFTVTGENLKDSHVERAVNLSADKYCSASIMLGKGGVKITHDYEILNI